MPAGDPDAYLQALKILHSSGIVVFPTDTVYGVGSLIHDAQAIEELYIAKGREANKAIAILLAEPAALDEVAGKMGSMALRFAERFWPGALTLVVPCHPGLPSNLSPLPTIGVRMPNHPVALELLRQAGPMAVTSANLSGQESTTTAQEVYDQLVGRIPLILDGGRTPGGTPSTVVDCTRSEPVILRPGPISLEMLQSALT